MTWTTLPRSESPPGMASHRTGSGPPVVLLHGVGLRAESWWPQIQALSCMFTVWAPDLPGHGESAPIDDAEPTLDAFTRRIALFINTAIGQPVVLIGHSMGAMIALDLAIGHRSLCLGVAALNAIHRREPQARAAVARRAAELRCALTDDIPDNTVAAPVKRWFGEPPAPADAMWAEACRDWLHLADRGGYASAYSVFAREDGPSDAALRTLAVPALFITGDADPNSTPTMTQSLAQGAPCAEAMIVDNAGHMAPLTHSTTINPALIAFASKCVRQRELAPASATAGNSTR